MGIDSTSRHWLLRYLPRALRQRLWDAWGRQRMRDARRALARIGAPDHPLPNMDAVLAHLRAQALAALPQQVHRFDDLCGARLERLWPEEIAKHLLDAHGRIEPGGMLAIDGPNRRIASMLCSMQPGHTIELEPQEACSLLELAGFDVERCGGIWLCETDAGTLLPFEGLATTGLWPITRRPAHARERPAQSFAWWIEARRAPRDPDAAELRKFIDQRHAAARAERLQRFSTVVGTAVEIDGSAWFDSQGRTGALMYGPHAVLRAGRYVARLEFAWPDGCGAQQAAASAHVSAGPSNEVRARKEVPPGPAGSVSTVTLEFSLEADTANVQFVAVSPIGTRVRVRRRVALEARAA
jgi:hypothetical protein